MRVKFATHLSLRAQPLMVSLSNHVATPIPYASIPPAPVRPGRCYGAVKAYMVLSVEATYTTPSATTGEAKIASPVR